MESAGELPAALDQASGAEKLRNISPLFYTKRKLELNWGLKHAGQTASTY